MQSYLLFHSLAEIAAATISFGTFLFAWNTRRFQNPYLLAVGIGSLFVGVFEVLHCLAFPGMPVFTAYDSNLSPQLWLSARFFQAGASLTGLLLLRRRPVRPDRLMAGFAAAFTGLYAAVFLRKLPDAVLQPSGLTPFKIGAEWVLAAAFLGSVALLFQAREAFSDRVFRFLAAHGIAMAVCDVSFTFYAHPHDLSNFVGHVLLLAGGSLQYMAILRAGLIDPNETHFRDLTQAKDRLELAQSAGRIGTFEWEIPAPGNTAVGGMEAVCGKTPGLAAGPPGTWRQRVHRDDVDRLGKLLADVIAGRAEYDTEYRVVWPDGSVHWVAARARLQRDPKGRPARLVGVNVEITDLKRGEEALRESEERLRLFVEHAPASLAMFDREMRYLSASRRWIADYRLGDRDLRGLPHYEVFPEIGEDWKRAHHRAMGGEVVRSEADRFVRADGSVQWLRWEVRPWRDAYGGIGGIVIFSEDITDRRRAEEALRDSELRFRLVLRNAPVSVSAQDRDLRYIWAFNQASLRPEEIIGKVDSEIYIAAEAELLMAIKRRVLDENIELREQMWLDRPRGRVFFDFCFQPIRDEDGTAVGVGTAAVDLTPMKLAEAAQQALSDERAKLLESERLARSEAERANRLKDEFLANISHELRTPLNAILGWTQILRKEQAEPGMIAKGLEVIERNTRIQTQLVSDLLDVSRIISGKMRLETEHCNPVLALESALDSLAPAAEAKRILIETAIEPLPGRVLGDPSRLQQIFWNLLSNAVKFMPAGGRVQVALRRNGPRIEIVFRDNGKGIRAEFLPHIFERFRQADSSAAKRHAGLGLGLAIVKHLVELHGGTVEAESPGEGAGATFTVSLPVSTESAAAGVGVGRVTVANGSIRDIALDGIRVLLVDDEPETLEVVKRLLEERGAGVCVADSAARGIAALKECRPDVLVGDIGMPGEDGYQMMRKIRALASEEGGQTPAVALTAYSRIEDRTRAILAGYQYYITKPVDASELIATLGMVTRRLPKPDDPA